MFFPTIKGPWTLQTLLCYCKEVIAIYIIHTICTILFYCILCGLLPQSLITLVGCSGPWLEPWVWEQWLSICGHEYCKGSALLAECSQVHAAWWDSSQSSKGTGRFYGRIPLCHLPRILGVWGGPYWLNASPCYSHL